MESNLLSKKLRFVPFDSGSSEHAERLRLQRVACGWAEDMIEPWRQAHGAGTKGIYWLVLRDDLPDADNLIEKHRSKYPEERLPLIDTSASVLGSARTPTAAEIVPVGHIAIERQPAKDEYLGLAAGEVAWITSLYLSYAMHNRGLGRDAMRWAEEALTREPFGVRVAYLDTTDKSFQLQEHVVHAAYTERGHDVPEALRSNEEWYRHQGYEVVRRKADGYPWITEDGEKIDIPLVFLKKQLA